MAYNNIDWINNDTPLNADNMNNIMEGISLALGYTDGSEFPKGGITKPTPFRLGIANYSIVGNDVENNKSYGEYSTALGTNTVAGSNAFKITDIDKENSENLKIILLNIDDIKKILAIEPTLEYSCQLGSNYDLCGNIIDVDESDSSVIVDKLPNTQTKTGTLWIPSHPELGDGETFVGTGATSFGHNNISSQSGSFAAGVDNIAAGKYSIVSGDSNIAGYASAVFGQYNKASQWSLIGGYSNEITKQFSFIVGYDNKINADKSGIIGEANEIKSGTGSFIIGRNNTSQYSADNPLNDPGCNFVGGYNSVLVGKRSFVFGTSLGSGPTAGYGNYVIAIGAGAQAGNPDAPSNSPTQGAVSIGWGTKALYNFSTALGTNTQTAADKQLVCGTWNTLDTNSAFIIGNGTSDSARSYAFNVRKNGQALLGNENILNDNRAVATKKYVDDKVVSQVSQVYDSTSSQAMSGVAVAGALSGLCQHRITPDSFEQVPGVPDLSSYIMGCRCIKVDNFVNYQTYNTISSFYLSDSSLGHTFDITFPYRADITSNPQVSANGKLKLVSGTVMYDIYAVTFDSYGYPESICVINSQTNGLEEFTIGETDFITYGLNFNYICRDKEDE